MFILLKKDFLYSNKMYWNFYMLQVSKIRTKKYGARRFSYAAVTLWNAISNDGFENSKHVDDFRNVLKTYLFKKYFYFGTQPVQFYFWSSLYVSTA